MHTSRMRTARLLTVSHAQGGVSQHALGGGVSQNALGRGCVCQGCLPGGVWQTPPGARGRHPPVNRMTDRCKNITLLQLRCGW